MQILDNEIVFKRGRPKKGEVRTKVEKGYCPIKRRKAHEASVKKKNKNNGGKTFGEVWVAHLNHPDYFKSEDFGKSPPACPKRMSFDDAITYYKAKLQNVWDELYPVKTNDFLKVDDYFDYYEAKRVANNMIFGVAV